MTFYLSKFLWYLFNPFNCIIFLLILSVILNFLKFFKFSKIILYFSFLLFFIIGVLPTGSYLLYLLEKNYVKSSIYFNSIIRTRKFSNLEKLIAQSLLSYVKVFENRSHDYEPELNIITKNYKNFALISNAFISCYLDNKKAEQSFLRIINPDTLNFTRYNFFYINFLVSKNRNNEALKILEKNNFFKNK